MALNFQNNGSVALRRVLVAALLAVSLIMVTAYSREGESGPLHSVQGVVSGLSSPFQSLGSAIGSAGNAVSTVFGDATADESTLSGLRQNNAELRQLLAQADEYKQEVERLEALLNVKNTSGIDGVTAQVVGRSSEAWNQTITLNCGENEGVDSGMTVMGSAGVIGQVVSATSSTATVRLLTDPQSGCAALIQSSRTEGIVRGSLDGLLYLENVALDASVQVGDVVITSGMGGSYTSGLIIGTVVKVDTRQGEATQRIVVSPNGSTAALEEVLVVQATGSSNATSGTEGGAS